MTMMNKWTSVLDRSISADRRLRELAEKPFTDLMAAARSGDLEILNYLLRHTSLLIIQKKSEKTCSQLFHLGERCDGLFCDGALASCVEVAVHTIFGTSADLSKEPQRSIAIKISFDEIHARDVTAGSEKSTKSVINYWDNELKATDIAAEVWLRQMSTALGRTGWTTDCRRKWNQTRQLAQRMDQANYFMRNNELTPLGVAFTTHWNQAQTTDRGLGVSHFHLDDLELLTKEIRQLVTWLGAIYDDACEPWLEGEIYNCRRILINLEFKFEKKIKPDHIKKAQIDVKIVEEVCRRIESTLREAYTTINANREMWTICNFLDAARMLTRNVLSLIESDVMELVEARSHLDGTGRR